MARLPTPLPCVIYCSWETTPQSNFRAQTKANEKLTHYGSTLDSN